MLKSGSVIMLHELRAREVDIHEYP